MALHREKPLLDELAARGHHVVAGIPKHEPTGQALSFPLFRSCPKQWQSELWEKTPFSHPILPCSNANAFLWTVTRNKDFYLGVSAVPCLPTPQRSSSAWATKHKYRGTAVVKMLAMTQDRCEALHRQHTLYRKWRSYPWRPGSDGWKSPCPVFPTG